MVIGGEIMSKHKRGEGREETGSDTQMGDARSISWSRSWLPPSANMAAIWRASLWQPKPTRRSTCRARGTCVVRFTCVDENE